MDYFASKGTKWITFVCVNWIGRQRKPKNILTRRKWCEKDFLKRFTFFFAIQFRRLVRLQAVTIKFFLMVKKHFKSKNFIDTEYSET